MLGCRTTLILKMPGFKFWLFAGFCHSYGVIGCFLVIVFQQKIIEKPSRDMPRLNTEARGYYTTPFLKRGVASAVRALVLPSLQPGCGMRTASESSLPE